MKIKEIDVSGFTAEQFDAFLGYCQEEHLKVGERVLGKIKEWIENPISMDEPDADRRCLYIREAPEDHYVTYGVGLLSRWQPDLYALYKPSFHTKCVMTLKAECKMVTIGSETVAIDDLRKALARQGIMATLYYTDGDTEDNTEDNTNE